MYYGMITMYCPNCGTETNPNSEFCQKCGTNLKEGTKNTCVPPNVTYALPLKSTGLAAVLSFLFAGLGQVYVGKIARGIIFVCIGACIGILSTILMLGGIEIDTNGELSAYTMSYFIAGAAILIAYLVFWVWQIFDAHNLANQYNDALRQTGNEPW